MKILFHKFWQNIVDSFLGMNLAWHFVAIVLTYVLVVSGFDWFYYKSTWIDATNEFIFSAILLGGLIPLIGLPILLLVGKISKSLATEKVALVLGQAALIGYLISTTYKIFTGRAHPELFQLVGDITRDFQFGFLERGFLWGWPSSHTAVAFAMALAFLILYPKKKKTAVAALAYALFIGIGVSVSVHWFSDFAAGAIIGSVAGITVGKSFRERGV